jgi:hypothetical protein
VFKTAYGSGPPELRILERSYDQVLGYGSELVLRDTGSEHGGCSEIAEESGHDALPQNHLSQREIGSVQDCNKLQLRTHMSMHYSSGAFPKSAVAQALAEQRIHSSEECTDTQHEL